MTCPERYIRRKVEVTTQISKQYDAIVPNNFTATFNPQQSTTYIRFGYGINVNAPSISALQPVIQNTNPFYITEIWNLKPTVSLTVSAWFVSF